MVREKKIEDESQRKLRRDLSSGQEERGFTVYGERRWGSKRSCGGSGVLNRKRDGLPLRRRK